MPRDRRISRLLERFPALKLIGNTPMVLVDVLGNEVPEVEVLAKMECLDHAASREDRLVLRTLLSALDGRCRRRAHGARTAAVPAGFTGSAS